jgi:hypothetical protein
VVSRESSTHRLKGKLAPTNQSHASFKIMTTCAYVPAELRNKCWYKMQDQPKTPRTRTIPEVHHQGMYMSETSVLCRILMMQLEHKSISLHCLDHLAALRKEYPGRFIIIIFDTVEIPYSFRQASEMKKRECKETHL